MINGLDGVLSDIRVGSRSLLRNPRLTVVAVLTLSVAIGAVAVVFSIFDAVVLRAIPGPFGDRLVSVAQTTPTSSFKVGFTHQEVENLGRNSTVLEAVGSFTLPGTVKAGDTQRPQGAVVAVVSGSFFRVFGVEAAVGRSFDAADTLPGRPQVVVVGYSYWRQRLGASRILDGVSLRLDGVPHQVIGVMPRDFRMPTSAVDVWLPDIDSAAERGNTAARQHQVIARVRAGVPTDVASRALTVESVGRIMPLDPATWHLSVVSLRDELVGPVGRVLPLLFGAVVTVLLIACVNVAMLLIRRNMARRREFELRLALGATDARLVWQSWLESTLLGVAGGSLGILLALAVLRTIRALGPTMIPRLRDSVIDGRVLSVAVVAGLVASAIGGLLPAMLLRESELASTVRWGAHSSKARLFSRLYGGGLLLIGQVALALVLVASASQFLQGLTRLLTVDVGFNPKGLFGVQLEPAQRLSDLEQTEFLTDQLRRIPGVGAVALTRMIRNPSAVSLAGERAPGVWIPLPRVPQQTVSDNYFSMLGIRLVAGRTFGRDDSNGPCVAIINQLTAAAGWPGGDAVGHSLDLNASLAGIPTGNQSLCQVVGVVGNTRSQLESAAGPQVYFSSRQRVHEFTQAVMVRLTDDSARVRAQIMTTARSLEPRRRIEWAGSIEDLVQETIVSPRFYALVFWCLAGVGVALTAIGIYGMMMEVVSSRWREIGVRFVVGARPRDITLMLFRFALIRLGLGLVAGLVAAAGTRQWMRSAMFDVPAGDFTALTWACSLTLAAGLLAVLLPARLASRMDPADLLRTE